MRTVKYEDIDEEIWRDYRDCMWGPAGSDELTARDLDEAIEELINDCWPDLEGLVLEVQAYRQVVVGLDLRSRMQDDALDAIFRILNDNGLSDPDEAPQATDRMRRSAYTFVADVLDEYEVWAHEPVLTVLVDAAEYAKKHMDLA